MQGPTIAPFDHKKSVLLVLDAQNWDSRLPHHAKIRQVISSAQQKRIPVVYAVKTDIQHGITSYPEDNHSGGFWATLCCCLAGPMTVYPDFTYTETDLVVKKYKENAFYGNDLTIVLKAQKAENIILVGGTTGGSVLSTVRHAADADYRLIVVKDTSIDLDQQVYDVLMTHVLPVQAKVITADDLIKEL